MEDQQLSYRQTPLLKKLLYTTMPRQVQKFADVFPDKEACVVYDVDGSRMSITNSDLYKRATEFARGLIAIGIKPGDIVALSLPNGPEWMVCTFGIQLAGAVPLHFMFYRRDGNDIANALSNVERCPAILFDPGENNIYLEISRKFIRYDKNSSNVESDKIKTLKHAIICTNDISDIGGIRTEDVLQIGRKDTFVELPNLDPDDLAAILLTSGSTGTPKPVQLSHMVLLHFGESFTHSMRITGNDVYYSGNSFNWAAGYPHCYLRTGLTTVTCRNLLMFTSINDINAFIVKAVSREQCTAALLSVPCVQEMIKGTNRDFKWASSLKTILTSGLPILSSTSKILEDIPGSFVVIYGATEFGGISALRTSTPGEYPDYCVGNPMPGVEMKVVDDEGQIVRPNVVGELYLRNLVRPLGYYNNKAMTEKILNQSGWYKTDDVGYMTEDGAFVVCGRKSDTLIVGGELVSPSYLESIISKHEGVQDVAVVPVSDENMFQEICACIIPRKGSGLDENIMKSYFKDTYAVIPACRGITPKHYIFLDAFPKSPVGKLSRKELKDTVKQKIRK